MLNSNDCIVVSIKTDQKDKNISVTNVQFYLYFKIFKQKNFLKLNLSK